MAGAFPTVDPFAGVATKSILSGASKPVGVLDVSVPRFVFFHMRS